jgi:1,4-alpha-glucan branching enzyme
MTETRKKKDIAYVFQMHAYIPYVLNHFFEDWLHEAIDEVYLPAIMTLRRLHDEGTAVKIMMDLVPVTADQLRNPVLGERFEGYLRRKIDKYRNDERIFQQKGQDDYLALARSFGDEKQQHLDFFRSTGGDVIGEFKRLQDLGVMQIGTSALTHPILPLIDNESQGSQIDQAVVYHRSVFGRAPAFFWSPECVIYPKLEQRLFRNGIRFLFSDGFPVEFNKNSSLYPCKLPNGVTLFGRHGASVRFLWDWQEGFAGNPEYKDFYREYERVTDRTGMSEKKVYDRTAVMQRIKQDVETFIKYKLEPELRWKNGRTDAQLCITHCIDAEFWGHWCYEGWDFVYELAKQLERSDAVEFVFADEYAARNEVFQTMKELPLASWGVHGNLDQWLTPATVNANDSGERKLWNYIWDMERKYWNLVRSDGRPDDAHQRLVRQMWREVLLAQHSDWLFMYVNGDGNYAMDRVREHFGKFMELFAMYHQGADEGRLRKIEEEDCIFQTASIFERSAG